MAARGKRQTDNILTTLSYKGHLTAKLTQHLPMRFGGYSLLSIVTFLQSSVRKQTYLLHPGEDRHVVELVA